MAEWWGTPIADLFPAATLTRALMSSGVLIAIAAICGSTTWGWIRFWARLGADCLVWSYCNRRTGISPVSTWIGGGRLDPDSWNRRIREQNVNYVFAANPHHDQIEWMDRNPATFQRLARVSITSSSLYRVLPSKSPNQTSSPTPARGTQP